MGQEFINLLNRRRFLKSTAYAMGGLCSPAVLSADNCNEVELLIANAIVAQENSNAWALSSPPMIETMLARIDDLENALAIAAANENNADKVQTLEYFNAVGTIGFAIAGMATTGPALGLVIAGSIFFGSSVIVARSIVAPETIETVEIASEVGSDRLGSVLGAYADSAKAMSSRAATVTGRASSVLSLYTIVSSWSSFLTLNDRFQDAVARRDEIQTKLADARAGLQDLRDTAYAAEVRRACMKYLEEDLSTEFSCKVLP